MKAASCRRSYWSDVERLSTLVEDLLLLARADADRPRPSSPRMFDTCELVEEVASAYAAARVPVAVEDALPRTGDPDAERGHPAAAVAADRDELRRVLTNLVDNAVRHATSEVRLAVRPDPDAVIITVTDDGPGIPFADRERVFNRSTRLDDARDRDAGGTGLGLAIVRELRSGPVAPLASAPTPSRKQPSSCHGRRPRRAFPSTVRTVPVHVRRQRKPAKPPPMATSRAIPILPRGTYRPIWVRTAPGAFVAAGLDRSGRHGVDADAAGGVVERRCTRVSPMTPCFAAT